MKKIFSFILAFILITSAVLPVSAVTYGDTNGDGKLNSLDVVVLSRYLANWKGYSDILVSENASLDGDDEITPNDSVILTRKLADWEEYQTLPLITEYYDYKVFTAEQLYDIMPAQETGTLSTDGEYIRFTGGDIAFNINDLDQFDASVYKYMVVGARASEANGNAVPANAFMWYNNNSAFGARYDFTSSFGQCWSWKSKNKITETGTFGKLNFTVTDAKRADNSSRDIDYSRGITSLVLKPYHSTGMLSEGQTFDVQYVAFFKTSEEASSFKFDEFNSLKAAPAEPMVRDTQRPVIVLKFDDLGKAASVTGFDRIAKILEEKNITGSFGIVANHFASASNASVFPYVQKWDEQGIEMWSHGYKHTKEEFSTDPYETQYENFKNALDIVKEKTGVEIKVFGSPHNNSGRDTLIMVKDNFPEINTFFHGFVDDNVSSVYHLRNHCGIEVSTGVTDYNYFLLEYSQQKYHSHLFVQTHPGQWKDADFENFEKMLDYLIADGCTFMTPSQATADHYARKPVEVRVENEYITLGTDPVIQNNVVFVPFADVAEALDAAVPESENSIIAEKGDLSISITGTSAQINGSDVTFEAAPITSDGTMLVPVSFIAEAFDTFAHWEADTKTVTLLPDLGKQELGETGLEIVKATYDDYQKDHVMLGEFSFDGDNSTAWYCEGKTDREIVYELADTATVKSAEIVWYSQNAPFEILVSNDNVNFEPAAQGIAPGTFGEKQTVNINKEAKYIKVVTKYNGINYDHGISEISFTK